MSPPSAGGLGKQLVPRSVSTAHTKARNNKRVHVVFLMGGMTRLYHIRGGRGNCYFRSRKICGILSIVCSTMRPAVMPSLITDAAKDQRMRSSLARRVITVLLAQSLFLSLTFAKQQTQVDTRQRRTQTAWPQPAATNPII